MTLFLLVLLTAFVFEYINGFHDSANAIATVVSTKVLSPRRAVLWAAFWNLFDPFRTLWNRECSGGFSTRLLRSSQHLPARTIQHRRCGRQFESISLQVLCSLCSRRMEGQQPPDVRPGTPLGLPQCPVRNARQAVLDQSRQCVRRVVLCGQGPADERDCSCRQRLL